MTQRTRRGIVMQTVMTSMMLGLVGLGATSAWRVRQTAQQVQARQEAARDAQFAGESALEEAVARLTRPPAGAPPFEARKASSIEPAVTRSELAHWKLADRVSVSGVTCEPRQLIEEEGKLPQGVLDLSVRVQAGRASLFGPGVSRRLVRRYRFQVLRARNASGTAFFEHARLSPEPLAQWVAE